MTNYQKSIARMAEIRGCGYKNMLRRMRKYDNPAVALYGDLHSSRRRAKRYNYRGGIYTVPELSRMAGISENNMRIRLRTKTVDEAVELPDQRHEVLHPYRGGHYTVTQLAKMAGCGISSIRKRIRKYGSENCMNVDNKGGAKPKLYTYQGKQYTITQLSEIYGVTDAAIRRNIKLYGVDKAVDMAKARQRIKSQPKPEPMTPAFKAAPDIEPADPDYELKNRIESYRRQGWSDDEILAKLRAA